MYSIRAVFSVAVEDERFVVVQFFLVFPFFFGWEVKEPDVQVGEWATEFLESSGDSAPGVYA